MIVYRIEHKDSKVGPFQSCSMRSLSRSRLYGEWRFYFIQSDNSHPTPYNDRDLGFELHSFIIRGLTPIFGVDSLRQAKHWLGDYWKLFHNHGFVIRKYDAERDWCKRGNFQVVFSREKANLLETIRLRKLKRL